MAQLVIMLLLVLPAFALPSGKSIWEYDRRIWQTQDGLPEDTIQAITQTTDGYLWVGTREGLARFDGFRFVVFDHSNTPAFHDDSVLSLYQARNGALWIGTEGGGLVRLKDGAFTAFNARGGLTDGFVRAIFQDHRGRLLVGTDHGLFRLQKGRFIRIDGRGDLPEISVHAIAEDRQGRLWVGGSGLYVIGGSGVKRIRLGRSAASDQIKSIFASADGTIWVGTYAGLYRLKNDKILHAPIDKDVEANILADHDGNVWVGWVGGGLSRFHDGRVITYHAPGALPNNTVLSIFEDSDRDLWVGTENGILRISDTGVSVLENKDGLSLGNTSTIYENVCTIYEAPDGTLWIANGHLYQIKGFRLIPFAIPADAGKIKVRTVFEDRRGALWIGTGGQGVVEIRNGTVIRYTTRQGLVNDFIRAFCEDRDGNLWIGTDGGVSRWNGKSFKNFTPANGLVYPSVRAIIRAKDGDLWIGTDGGLSRIHEGAFVNSPALDLLRGDQIYAIREDKLGALWLGTNGAGLYRLKNGKLSHYTTRCGLPGDSIYQILEDRHRNLWFSGSAGIFQISLRSLDSRANCTRGALAPTIYGSSEESEAGEVNGGVQPAGSSAPDGALWFPTIKGAIRIEPDEVRPSHEPRALIEKVIADGHDLPLNSSIRIPPGRGQLEIHYTAPSLYAPEQIRFKYRLDGLDRQWTSAGTRRVAYYTNLPPGHYRFRVEAFDNGAPAKVSEADFAFDWQAHFYQTAWFYVLCALFAGAVAWAGFRLHMSQVKGRYAAVLAERSRLAREMHDTVIQGCVGVSTLLEAASIFEPPPPEMVRDLLDRARSQVRQTLNEAREAVWNLRYTSIEAHGLVPALSQLAQRLTGEGGAQVRVTSAGTTAPLSPQITNSLLLVAREAARNALAHGNPKSIVIALWFERKRVRLEVADNGCGFEMASFLLTPNGHYGIAGMRERMEQLGGNLLLESRPGKGTRVVATIPSRS